MIQHVERLRGAFADRSQDAAALSDCPPPERIFDAATGRADPSERTRTVDHVSACAACAEAWRLALAFEGAPLPRRQPWKGPVPLAAAAVLVLAVGVTQLMPPAPSPYRDGGGARPESALAVERLPREAFVLRWSLPDGYTTRAVRVLRPDLEPLHLTQNPSGNSLRVPAEALAGLPSGSLVLWQVEAEGPDGGVVNSATWRIGIAD